MTNEIVKKITPIFVVGRHRSGTTWVTNILAAHEDVFTPQHEAHYGQIESGLFTLLRYFNWGKTKQDRIAFQAVFERSDFFHLALGTQPQEAPSAVDRSIGEYFRAVMDQAARMRGCTYWVEKTPGHTLFLREIVEWFPDAKIIAVRRNILDVVRSLVYQASHNPSLFSWIRATAVTVAYEKIMSIYKRKLYWIKYEDLLEDFEGTVSRLLQFLGLDPSRLGSNIYQPNTSFRGERPPVPLGYKVVTWLTFLAVGLIPTFIVNWLVRFYVRSKRPPIPQWFFKVYGGKGPWQTAN